jgi:mannose PTS system EIIA component
MFLKSPDEVTFGAVGLQFRALQFFARIDKMAQHRPTRRERLKPRREDKGFHMIGLVLVTHGRLAEEFRSALEHVVGPQTNIATISMHPDDDVESRRGDIIKAVGTVDSGRGVVILTDMFGGTPSNLAISVMETGKVEVIAGMNLPMLVKLASVRGEAPLEEAVEQAQEAGRKYINVASRLLGSHT